MEEFHVVKFPSSLDSAYVEVKHSILIGEKLLSLTNVYAQLQHIDLLSFSFRNGIEDTFALASITQSIF